MQASWWERVLEKSERRRARRSTIAALAALGDRELRDIGIDRSEIVRAAERAVRAAPAAGGRRDRGERCTEPASVLGGVARRGA